MAGMNGDRNAYIRLLLLGLPVGVTLAAFALYFGVRNAGYFRKGPAMILWGATAGLLTAVTNMANAMLVMPLVFWCRPVLRNESGGFSPFTTTFLDEKRRQGSKLAEHLASVVNDWDPGHFK